MSAPTAATQAPGIPFERDHSRAWIWRSIVGIALLSLLAAGIAWLHRGSSGTELGISPETTYVTFPLSPGTPVSLGVQVRGEGPIEILDIKPLTSSNVDYLGAFTIWPRDLIDYGAVNYSGPGFPAPEQRRNHPALGVVVPAAELAYVPPFLTAPPDLTLTVGFRLREGTVGAMNGFLLTYRAHGKVVHRHVREAIIMCVEPKKKCLPDSLPGGGDPESVTLRDLGVLKD